MGMSTLCALSFDLDGTLIHSEGWRVSRDFIFEFTNIFQPEIGLIRTLKLLRKLLRSDPHLGVSPIGADGTASNSERATQIVEEAKGQAKEEGDRLVAGAKAEIEQEVHRAKESLRQQVADLAIAGAEKILRREIDAKAHVELLTLIKSEL